MANELEDDGLKKEIQRLNDERIKGEVAELLDELARSYDVKVDFQFFATGNPNGLVFEFNAKAYRTETVTGAPLPAVKEQEHVFEKYARNWNNYYWKWRLDRELLGKVVEYSGRYPKIKILGLEGRDKRKKHPVVVLNLLNNTVMLVNSNSLINAKVVG